MSTQHQNLYDHNSLTKTKVSISASDAIVTIVLKKYTLNTFFCLLCIDETFNFNAFNAGHKGIEHKNLLIFSMLFILMKYLMILLTENITLK